MERLPKTEPRSFEEVEQSFDNWVNWERESKIKRLQQLGQMKNWKTDEALFRWLKEAEYCYVMGFYLSAAFFAGSTLELGMKLHSKNWISPDQKVKGFKQMIDCFYNNKKISQQEYNMAHEIRIIRNLYGHANVEGLAEKAVENGVKIKIGPVMLTKDGIKEINDAEEKIIEKPTDDDMKFVFQYFNAEQLAWKSIKNVHTILLKLYPYNENSSE